ncbi:MAG: DUF5320 domain-containing protein [Candidatus Aminicenantales bacterium]
MPLGDRTGPWSLGPMTGRAMGYCAGFPFPGFRSRGYGFGRRFRFGRGFSRALGLGIGRGWRRAGFLPGWGYPYPWGMPYGLPFAYGYPCGVAYSPYLHFPWMPQAGGQKEQKNE